MYSNILPCLSVSNKQPHKFHPSLAQRWSRRVSTHHPDLQCGNHDAWSKRCEQHSYECHLAFSTSYSSFLWMKRCSCLQSLARLPFLGNFHVSQSPSTRADAIRLRRCAAGSVGPPRADSWYRRLTRIFRQVSLPEDRRNPWSRARQLMRDGINFAHFTRFIS